MYSLTSIEKADKLTRAKIKHIPSTFLSKYENIALPNGNIILLKMFIFELVATVVAIER